MEHDERAGARSVGLRIGLDPGSVQDERLRAERGQLVGGRLDEHRLREQGVVRAAGDDPDGDPVRGVGAREGVDDVQLAAVEVRDDLVPQRLETVLGQWLVHGPHQMRSPEPGSRTTNLSFGERPVNRPVSTTSGPPSASFPSPRPSACV